MRRRYDWERFWCPREGSIHLGDQGFLSDPTGKYGRTLNPDVVPFSALEQVPCLALLGEPGIGKSTVIEEIRDFARERAEENGHTVLFVNLNEYGADESRLICDIFELSLFQNWLKGDGILELFLDSLDECRIQIPKVARILANQFQRIQNDLNRLRLRIACRTADWPNVLDQTLPELWGEDSFGAYELAPLRRRDVLQAAQDKKPSGEAFVSELVTKEVVPLAIRPATLFLLLDVYQVGGALPDSRRELYRQGCLKLCEETNPDRLDLEHKGGAGKLSAAQRMKIASYLAAISVFCRKPVVLTGTRPALQVEEEIHYTEIVGEEPFSCFPNGISKDDIIETLGTGLFTSRGSGRTGFSHQTYAEFLASYFFEQTKTPTHQVAGLLTAEAAGNRHVVPQLMETAAWIAGVNPDIRDIIVDGNPQVLLRADAACLADDDREAIVSCMLRGMEEGKLNDYEWDIRRHYAKLNHPRLAEQLRPWFKQSATPVAHRSAIAIAGACCVKELQYELLEVALSTDAPYRSRELAMEALAGVGDREVLRKLMQLITREVQTETEEEMKGKALKVLWPGSISAEEVFRELALPLGKFVQGEYEKFIGFHIAEHLKPPDLLFALGWIKQLKGQELHKLNSLVREMVDNVVVLSLKHLDHSHVSEDLAEIFLEKLSNGRPLLEGITYRTAHEGLFEDAALRRRLVLAIIQQKPKWSRAFALTCYWPKLVRADDLDWVLEGLQQSVGTQCEKLWADLAFSTYQCGDHTAHRTGGLFEATKNSPLLRQKVDDAFAPVMLDSQDARNERDAWNLQNGLAEGEQEGDGCSIPAVRIIALLEKIESGKPQAWYDLLYELARENGKQLYPPIPELDLTSMRGWRDAEGGLRERILRAAQTFLREVPPPAGKWLKEPSSCTTQDYAHYSALMLLHKEDENAFHALPQEIWIRELGNILCVFVPNDKEMRPYFEIAKAAYSRVPDQFIARLLSQLDAESAHQLSCHRKLVLCWDQRLLEAVAGKLSSKPMIWPTRFWEDVAGVLVNQGHEPVLEELRSTVAKIGDEPCPPEPRAVAAARLLCRNMANNWPIVWKAVERNAEFGRALAESLDSVPAPRDEKQDYFPWTESQAGDFYLFLEENYPPEKDMSRQRGEGRRARELRDGLFRYLRNRGTAASLEQMQRIADVRPDDIWRQYAVVEARKVFARNNWTPLSVSQFQKLIGTGFAVAVADSSGRLEIRIPEHIILCEGRPKSMGGGRNADFDAKCYNAIFAQEYPDVIFCSAGGSSELDKNVPLISGVLANILPSSKVTQLVDRDDRSDAEIKALNREGILVLNHRDIENYLWDDEVLGKLCEVSGRPELEAEVLQAKADAVAASVSQGKPLDDIKSASGPLSVRVKKLLDLTQCGNTKEAFCRDTLVPLIEPGMQVYDDLKHAVFGNPES